MPAELTCTGIRPSAGTGSGTSCSSSTSGPPKRFTCIALMCGLSVRERGQGDTAEHQVRPAVAAELRPRQGDACVRRDQALELVGLELAAAGARDGLWPIAELDDRSELGP